MERGTRSLVGERSISAYSHMRQIGAGSCGWVVLQNRRSSHVCRAVSLRPLAVRV
eukprot:SAG11_NODE_18793_length_481_cov_0.808901_1_plen_54_part_10